MTRGGGPVARSAAVTDDVCALVQSPLRRTPGRSGLSTTACRLSPAVWVADSNDRKRPRTSAANVNDRHHRFGGRFRGGEPVGSSGKSRPVAHPRPSGRGAAKRPFASRAMTPPERRGICRRNARVQRLIPLTTQFANKRPLPRNPRAHACGCAACERNRRDDLRGRDVTAGLGSLEHLAQSRTSA